MAVAEHEETLVVGDQRYRLVPARGDALAPLVPLLAPTFRRRDFTLDWLCRKYGGEFGGLAGFSYLALTERGEAAASCGFLPWPIRFGDRVEIAAQVVDAATHAAHRRRGLFTRLAKLAHARCADAGVSFFFAFPHRGGDSYPGFVGKLGYSDIGIHNVYRRPIRTLWAERIARRSGLASVYQQYVERTFGSLAPGNAILPNSLVREGFAATDRSAAFYEYKTFAGSRVLQLDGGRVWLKVRHGFQIGDMEATTPADLERTVKAVEALAVRIGVHQIALHASDETACDQFLASRYPHAPSVAVIHRDVRSKIPKERLRFTLGDLDNF